MRLPSVIVIAFFFAAAPCFGQSWAWGPPRGEASYGVTYQANFINKHLLDLVEFDDGHIRSHSLRMELGYGVTDRLSAGFSIPYVFSRYRGSDPHQLPIDD